MDNLVKKYMNECNKIRKVYETKIAKYQNVINASRCTSCMIFKSEMIMKFEDRFKKCDRCSKFDHVYEAFDEVVETSKILEKFKKEQYGKVIYEFLNKEKPKILIKKTNEIISWDKAFPNNYNMFTSNDINALIALIEENGGKYRIAK